MVLLPGCPCCGSGSGSGCPCPEGEELPDKVTVALSGLTKSNVQLNLLSLSFSSCFGTGAAGTVKAPGGLPSEKGPIESVTLTQSGAGYAKLGRVEPTLTAVVANGDGATFTPTLTNKKGQCGFDYWEIGSLSVTGGTGYVDGDQVAFTVAEGDTEEQPASATIHTGRDQPTLSASAWGGTGATFSISYTKNGGDPATWTISDVSVTNGGTGYHGGSYLAFNLGTGDVSDSNAYAQITTNRSEPTLSASVSSETGSGAVLSVSLSSTYDYDGPAWAVSSIGITDGGTGYAEGDQVSINVVSGQQSEWNWFYGHASSVDENGSITAIAIDYPGAYFKDDGVITGVTLWSGGAYHKDNGIPTSVTVDSRGRYYREDASVPPYVADVTVSVVQSPPSAGSGAEISVEIDDNTSSDTFGVIRSLHLDNAGTGYLGWTWADCGVKRLNGRQIPIAVKTKTVSLPLTLSFSSCFGSGATGLANAPGGYPGVNNGPLTAVGVTYGGSGYAKIGREQPSLSFGVSISDSFGSGAAFTPTFSQHQDSCGIDYWAIESVAVSGGTCYGVKGRTAPTLSASMSGGSGASLVVHTTQSTDGCGGDYWSISSISLSLAETGTPYANNTPVTITAAEGATVRTAATATLQTDERGVPTGVTITEPGAYFVKPIDDSLVVTLSTADDKEQEKATLTVQTNDKGVPTGVTVVSKGRYYRENKSLTPYVANVMVALSQTSPSNGSGAVISATVNSNPYSADFGKIASVSLDNAGDGYLWFMIVKDCTYERCIAGGTIKVIWRGSDRPPQVQLDTDCHITFTADEADAPFSCDGMSFTATEPVGGTAVVSVGEDAIPTCEDIYAASSISVTMTGEDATVLYACEDAGVSLAQKTTGSRYNGTFSCEFVEERVISYAPVRMGKYYEHTIGEVCGVVSKLGVYVGHPDHPFFGIELRGVVCYQSENYLGTSQAPFECGPVGYKWRGGAQAKPPEGRFAFHYATVMTDGIGCDCDLESFATQWYGFFGGGSDEKSACALSLISLEGDPTIRVIRAEIGS